MSRPSDELHLTIWPTPLESAQGRFLTTCTRTDLLKWITNASTRAVSEKSELEGFSLARFADDYRTKENVIEVSAVGLDDDESGMSVDALVDAWKGSSGVVHTTHSSTPEAPRTRVILFTSRAMTGPEYERVRLHAASLATAKGMKLDESTKDASRFWYRPAVRPGAESDFAVAEIDPEHDGAPLDVDAILATDPPAPTSTKTSTSTSTSTSTAQCAATSNEKRRESAALVLGNAWPEKGRHHAQFALAGALRRDGWTKEDALEFLCDVCSVAGNEDRPKREKTIEHTYATDAHVTGWSSLEKHVDPVAVNAARDLLAHDAGDRAAWKSLFDSLDDSPAAEDAKEQATVKLSPRFLSPAQRALRIGSGTVKRISTGFPSLDAATRGGILFRKNVVIGGAPGAGKTAVLAKIAYASLCEGLAVGVLAADEDADAFLIRLGQQHGLDRGELEHGDDAARRALAAWLEPLPLVLLDGDDEQITVDAVSHVLAAVAPTGGVLLVDSLQTARCEEQLAAGAGMRERVNANVRAVKRAAKVGGHVVFATSELSKGAYRSQTTAENVNGLSAFKESGDIEYGFSVAVVLTSERGSSEVVNASVVKNRLGSGKPEFMLRLDHERASVAEIGPGEAMHLDPLHFVKERIKSHLASSSGSLGRSRSSIANRVGGKRQTVFAAMNQLVEAHVLHEDRWGLRFPLPGEPGYENRAAAA